MRLWGTPVLIPNTMVKTQTADGTVLETVWESRWLPEKASSICYQFIKRLLCNNLRNKTYDNIVG